MCFLGLSIIIIIKQHALLSPLGPDGALAHQRPWWQRRAPRVRILQPYASLHGQPSGGNGRQSGHTICSPWGTVRVQLRSGLASRLYQGLICRNSKRDFRHLDLRHIWPQTSDTRLRHQDRLPTVSECRKFRHWCWNAQLWLHVYIDLP